MSMHLTPPEDLSPWDYAHYLAIETWLNDYQPPPNASRLEQVQGFLEAIHHSCEAQLWTTAHQIARMRIPTHEAPLHAKLGQWGYYREQIELYQALCGRIHRQFDITCRQGLGQAYLQLSQYEAATAQFTALQTLAEEVGDSLGVMQAWGGLTDIAMTQYRYRQVIPLAQQWLAIGREGADLSQQAQALQRLGLAYVYLGRSQQGIKCLEEGRAIAQQTSDSMLLGSLLTALANAWGWQNQPAKALPYLTTQLELCRQQETGVAQIETLRLLGRSHFLLKETEAAVDYFEQALALAEKLQILGQLAVIYNDLGVAYVYGCRAFEAGISLLERSANRLQGEMSALPTAHLAYCYAALQQPEQAHHYIQTALGRIKPSSAPELKATKGVVYACLAKTCWEQHQYPLAFWFISRSLVISPPWQNANGRLVLYNLLQHLQFW
ncbi:MAG: tetratricopeptide repeat protein [Cyanobacteria bacterium P01_A01_bin.17]